MKRPWRILAMAAVGLLGLDSRQAPAQVPAAGGSTIVLGAPAPPAEGGPVVVKTRRARRARNPYFARRPTYAPANPNARANITFEPYTRWYYPNSNSYYPPLQTYPSIRP